MLNVLIDVRNDPAARRQLEAIPDLRITDIADEHAREGMPRELPADMLARQDLLFCSFPPVNHDALTRGTVIQIASAGYGQLLGLDLPGRGIRACNAGGVFDGPIAEWNVAMMINLKRNLREMIRLQEAGRWNPTAEFQREVRGSAVGLWGYGGIGRETARLCKALGLRVHVLTKSGATPRRNRYRLPGAGDPDGQLPDRVYTADERMEFLAGLDFLILSMPLNASTRGIVTERELRALPDHAFLLNPARGPLVEESALLRALRDGWIAGAALDTHYHYPMPADHPLWRLPNVIMTPHISGSADGAYYLPGIWAILLENIHRLRDGEPLLNELTPDQLSEEA